MAQLKDLLVSGVSRFIGKIYTSSDVEVGGKLKTNAISAPTASNGTTYGTGSNGQILKSNGTTVYWANDNNSGGTITGITMNGASKGTSGVVDLGTVITAHQDISGKLDKTTYEFNKELAIGSSGKVCIGTFPCYDTNVSVEIKSTTNATYNGVFILATQNINTSRGGTYKASVYGDYGNTLASAIKFRYVSGSNAISIYINLPSWSKNLIHVQCVSLAGSPTNIVEKIDEIPSDATLVPNNVATESFASKTHTHNASEVSGLATVATSGSYNDLSNKPTIPSAVTESTVSGWGFTKNTGTLTSHQSIKTLHNKTLTGTGNVTLTASDVGALPSTTTIPTVTDTYSATSSNAMSGKAVASAISGKGTYSKPSGGIPKSDLASAVQTSLGKADTALQSYTEQYTGTVKTVNGVSPDSVGNVVVTTSDTNVQYKILDTNATTSSFAPVIKHRIITLYKNFTKGKHTFDGYLNDINTNGIVSITGFLRSSSPTGGNIHPLGISPVNGDTPAYTANYLGRFMIDTSVSGKPNRITLWLGDNWSYYDFVIDVAYFDISN